MKYFLPLLFWLVTTTAGAGIVTVVNTVVTDDATMSGGGATDTSDREFVGVVSHVTPTYIRILSSDEDLDYGGVQPDVGDVVGRGFTPDFGTAQATWTIPLPSVPAEYLTNTFDIDVTFQGMLGFSGNAYTVNNPNGLDFALAFDGTQQTQFLVKAGAARSGHIGLTASFDNMSPVSDVTVTMVFPDSDSSFNVSHEAFRVFEESLTVTYSFDAVPEPSAKLYLGLALVLWGFGHRRYRAFSRA